MKPQTIQILQSEGSQTIVKETELKKWVVVFTILSLVTENAFASGGSIMAFTFVVTCVYTVYSFIFYGIACFFTKHLKSNIWKFGIRSVSFCLLISPGFYYGEEGFGLFPSALLVYLAFDEKSFFLVISALTSVSICSLIGYNYLKPHIE